MNPTVTIFVMLSQVILATALLSRIFLFSWPITRCVMFLSSVMMFKGVFEIFVSALRHEEGTILVYALVCANALIFLIAFILFWTSLFVSAKQLSDLFKVQPKP